MSSSTSLSARIASLSEADRDNLLASLSPQECESLLYDWNRFIARPEQVSPPGDWRVWLVMTGRGWGKTRTGAEWIRNAHSQGARRIAIVAETAADGRDIMVEGESGLLSCYPPNDRPVYNPSKRRITWSNGATALIINATEPDQLRGPQFDTAWCDELAKWRYAQEAWDQLQFALRLGTKPRVIVTTTPRPTPIIRQLLAAEGTDTYVTRGKTADNIANLAPGFVSDIYNRFGSTRLGRQELNGEVLGAVANALWSPAYIDPWRVVDYPTLTRIIVAVDPAVTDSEGSNETGIIVLGISSSREIYVIADLSTSGAPHVWARRVISAYDTYGADSVVVEVNQGGQLIAQTLRGYRSTLNITEVRAVRSKHDRAIPVSCYYEQGRVHHVGVLCDLEQQLYNMTSTGYIGDKSPDRLDALVWGVTSLFGQLSDRSIGIKSVNPIQTQNFFSK